MPMTRRRGGADTGAPRAGERERVPSPASWRARASGGSRLARAEYAPAAGFGGEYPPGGLDTFAAMQRDAQVRACLTTKRLAVLSEGVEVHPADGTASARRAADAVREQVDALPGGAAGVVEGALDALAMGYAVGELVWALDGSLEAVRWHNPRRFAFHAGPSGAVEEVEVRDAGGLRFPGNRFLLYAYQGRYGSPYGESDLVAAYRAWWTKDNLRRLWLAGLDRFGVPTPVARIPAGYSAEMARQVSERLGSIQAGGALTVPADVEVSFDLDAGRVEPARAYVTAIEYEDRQIARAILGGELTATGGDGAGSYALGRVHREVADDWIGALRRDIAGRVLTGQLARAVALYAAGPDAPCPRVRFPDLSPAELSARRDLVSRMVEGGVIAPDEGWLRAYLGLPARETTA
jgi:phage gp29-like protein